MKRHFFFIVAYLCFAFTAGAQGCPANLDFESGDFSNWDCFVGTTHADSGKNFIVLQPSPPLPGVHEIIGKTTPADLDKYGKFPRLCPYGGNYSVKLGNDMTGSEAEGLSYTFQVPSNVDTFSFTYFYAVVFQDPDHSLIQQPRFFVTAYDVESGKIINCASYDYVANGTLPGFQVSDTYQDVLFKNWSPASIEFAGLANRTIRLEFKTADCTLGGHFGYAYVDVGSGCSNLMATAPYCVETNSLVLNAPYGFQQYTWFNSDYSAIIGNKQSLTLSPPPATSGSFHVAMVPYPGYGCADTALAIITPLSVPDTPAGLSEYDFCQFERVAALTATPSQGCDLIWYSAAAGGQPLSRAPVPSTLVPGEFIYYVSQKVLFGCESVRRKITVRVGITPVASLIANSSRQCQVGNSFQFKSRSSNLSNAVYAWDFGDGNTLSSAVDSVVTHQYTLAGNFKVSLKITNLPKCSSEKTFQLTVVPKPAATFTYPAIVCEKQTTLNIQNTATVPGGYSAITNHWWSVDGSISAVQQPAAFVPKRPGIINVRFAVRTAEGCLSDTNSVAIPVHYQPAAAFRYNYPVCDNEQTQFSDLSTMPVGGNAEHITKWYWQFDGVNIPVQQHPLNRFNSGVRHAKLVVETEFGCKSPETDSLLKVNPKPVIAMQINDSCILRVIHYNAIDVSGTVHKWKWNFGNGITDNVPQVTRMYNKAINQPLILLATSEAGCRDTIIRPFAIYDNKAWAGRDTIAAMDEPVKLFGHGGSNIRYTWSPALGLDNANIENPVAILNKDQVYKLDAISDKGCDSHSTIVVKRYKGPELYIPTGFTPNGDGLNDQLHVIAVGISKFEFFAVYNRLGERIFYSEDPYRGWDGTYRGTPLATGNFVVMAKATDYRGKPMLAKVNVVLLR